MAWTAPPASAMSSGIAARPSFDAEDQIVGQRVDAGRLHVRIGVEIPGGVEARRRIAPLMPAEGVVMVERVGAAVLHVGVGLEIALGVEERIRIAPFLPADGLEVLIGIDARGCHVGIVAEVEGGIEAGRVHRRADQGGRVASPGFSAETQEVRQRIGTAGGQSRIVDQVGLLVERERRQPTFLPAEQIVVHQRIDARGGDVRVGGKVIAGVEEGIRIASLAPAHRSIVGIGVDMCAPDVVIVGVVEEIRDQRGAVALLDSAVGEPVGLEAGQDRVARRRVNDDLVSGVADDRVGQLEIENRDVVAAESIVTVVARRDRENIACERSGEDRHGIESLSLQPATGERSRLGDVVGRRRPNAASRAVLARGDAVVRGYVWLSVAIDALCVSARVARQARNDNINDDL